MEWMRHSDLMAESVKKTVRAESSLVFYSDLSAYEKEEKRGGKRNKKKEKKRKRERKREGGKKERKKKREKQHYCIVARASPPESDRS